MNGSWIRVRRRALKLTQADLVARLGVAGYPVSDSTMSNWENGISPPPLEKPEFREAMAKALEITINELLLLAGYTDTQEHSLAAKLAAEIVERLPPSAQELALDYLQMLEKRFPEVKAGNKVR